MEEIITKDKEFKDLVHVIRGQQIMLDSDLAELYGYEVSQFNRQVKRNINRFPKDFMFQLTLEEANEISRCHFGILKQQGKNIKYAPNVFTEQGIYMLSAVLKGELAEQQSIYIIREFKKMRHYLIENQQLLNNTDLLKLSNHILEQDKRILNIEENMSTKSDIDKIMNNFINKDNIKEKLFLDGQVFDAAEAYIQIYKQATKSIYIIDNYINIKTLGLLKNKRKNIEVTIFTSNKCEDKLRKLEIESFNKQYPSLKLKYTNKVHDRFIIIDFATDSEKIYICGASSKDAGQKICTISQLHNSEIMNSMIVDLLKNKDYTF